MYVIYDEDLIISKVNTPNYDNCIELPNELIDLNIDCLRFDGEKLIDVSNYTQFYIDENGEKHIQQDETNSRQLLECKWDDILIQDENNNWIVKTLDLIKEEKMKYVQQYRKQLENSGIYVNDFFIDTSETGRLNLSNTLNAYDWGFLDKTQPIDEWKCKNGEFKSVTYGQLKMFAGYVANYVENLFKSEKLHDANILQLTSIEEIENYDITTKWPAQQYYTQEN